MCCEENCKSCTGYTTCPYSTVWEDDLEDNLDLAWIENYRWRQQEE